MIKPYISQPNFLNRMILRPLRLGFALILGSSSLVFAQTPPPAPKPGPAEQAPTTTLPPAPKMQPVEAADTLVDAFKLSEVDIDSVLAMLEMLTGKTILRPASLPTTTYSLHLKKPMPRSEAILALETVLGLNNIGIAPMGDKFLKVVGSTLVRTEAPELISTSTLGLPPSGRIAAKFFQLEHTNVTEIQPLLVGIASPGVGQNFVSFQRANAILVTETITNLQRIESLIDSLDRPASTPKFYTLKFAKASELVQKVQAILQSQLLQSQFANNTTLTADDRTNQVVLVTDPKRQNFFDEMIEKLDVKADPNTRTEVIYLKHAASKDVASLLTSLISGQNNASQKTGAQQIFQRPDFPGAPGQPAQQQVQNAIRVGQQQLAGQLGVSSTSFSSIITVLADERTNAVIVNGTLDDIRLIKDVVDKVDIILPQVRIEVVIAEVTLTDNNTTGISALGLQVDGNKLIGIAGSLPGASFGGGTNADGATSSYATVNRPDSGGYTLSGILQLEAKPRKTNANILMVPSIITTHNKKAQFKVTTNYPTISSYLNDTASSGTGSTVGTGYRSTVGTTSVGTTLTVTPLIGDDGTVQMEIEQEVSDKLGTTQIDGNEQPIVGTRQTQSFVTVRSGEVIVLGGMQRNTETRSTSRLGPIPIIGDLLGSRSKEINRTDLIFFLRPVILTNTSSDNLDYLNRLETNPNRKDVKKALDPAAKEPEQNSKSKAPGLRRKK